MLSMPNQAAAESDPAQLPSSIKVALGLLLAAYNFASEVRHNVWDFAVEMSELRNLGLTNSDLRYLLSRGFALHQRELAPVPGEGRQFQQLPGLAIDGNVCVVLTDLGVRFARMLAKASTSGVVDTTNNGGEQSEVAAPSSNLPYWDELRRELRVGTRIVKRFRQPAPNQQSILAAFQAKGWPFRIDDPLPTTFDQNPKERLHDAIKHLNRNLCPRAIRFFGDGSGRGACWELLQ